MPTKRGFGITLIEKSLAGIGGSASLQFEAGGLRCSIRLPFAEDQAPVAPSPAD
jgi:two-component sensor histidine kinase